MGRASDNYYADERKTYRKAHDIYVHNDDVEFIMKKLCRKYNGLTGSGNLPFGIYFRGNRDSGIYYNGGWNGRRIGLSNGPSMGLIVHEFAHFVHGTGLLRDMTSKMAPNNGTSHHGSHFTAILRRIHTDADKVGYWEPALKRRDESRKKKKEALLAKKAEAEVKEPEVIEEPSPVDKGLEKIQASEEKISDWEQSIIDAEKSFNRKKKLYTNKIKKETARLKRMKKYREKKELTEAT